MREQPEPPVDGFSSGHRLGGEPAAAAGVRELQLADAGHHQLERSLRCYDLHHGHLRVAQGGGEGGNPELTRKSGSWRVREFTLL